MRTPKEDAPVNIGGQTPVLKRNALDNLDLAAECVLHFAKTGELYPNLKVGRSKIKASLNFRFIERKMSLLQPFFEIYHKAFNFQEGGIMATWNPGMAARK